MCKALGFARSTYYAAINHVPSKKEQEYAEFSNQVLSVIQLLISGEYGSSFF